MAGMLHWPGFALIHSHPKIQMIRDYHYVETGMLIIVHKDIPCIEPQSSQERKREGWRSKRLTTWTNKLLLQNSLWIEQAGWGC